MGKQKDIIDILGHELRTPATVIKLNTQFLEKFSEQIKKERKEFKKYIERIDNAVEEQLRLINTLSLSSGIDGKNIILNSERINIQERINVSISLLNEEAIKKGIKILNKVGSGIPEVLGDKVRVLEILNNVIGNAIKFTDRGSVTVKTVHDDNYVYVSVKDTGIGIKKEDIKNLGKKFFRIENMKSGGTGLGLYISYHLIKQMKGNITVKSRYKKGSTFILAFPRYKRK